MQMEQNTQYLMWMKSKDLIMNSFNHSMSWEEQAFAEDARGPLGGFVWPPRSYPCSFCKREFRSAQALGGHMNVHRRERARLKQSHHPKSPQSTLSSKSLESASNPSFVVASSSLSGSRVSTILGQENAGSSILDNHDHDHDHDNVETNLFVGALNLDYSGNSSDLNRVGVDHEEIVANFKRQKTTAVLSLLTSSVEGIDLELRLGDSPKVS